MKSIFTQEQFDKAKSNSLLQLCCIQCNRPFKATKKSIKLVINNNSRLTRDYCSQKCAGIARKTTLNVLCTQCGKPIIKFPCEISKNNFCNRSCSATYRNNHKSSGYRRSKLEIWLESQLTSQYNFEFKFNDTNVINSELDIYIPCLRLAFELNGIFHYEPIYGKDKLNKTQNNDNRKMQACLERNIELCIINTSGLKYFKPEKALMFLNIITKIIQEKKIIRLSSENYLNYSLHCL